MNMRASAQAVILTVGLVMTTGVLAQAPSAENPAHASLRVVRDGMIKAIRANDLDALVSYLHKDAVLVWLNGETTRGHDAVRAYYNRMMTGDKRIVDKFTVDVEAKELSFLYGDDTAVAYGTASSHFVLTDGTDLVINGPWSATLVEQDGKWLVASFQASANMFDNPVLDKAKAFVLVVAVIGIAAGLIVGMVVLPMTKRKGSF